ncbi:hypothetical protein LCGC14_0871470 [marine sediment metagenome]|uniref:Uncharacterized protein n=1 Tax=marine sediment metagenome TaxID=412755 RepID=A0A0F9P4P0_9ZZZZ
MNKQASLYLNLKDYRCTAIRKTKVIFFILIFTYFLVSVNYIQVKNTQINSKIEEIEVKISGPDLPDKVYTFLAPKTDLIFDDLFLEKHYKYYIYVELVTPHNCTLTITLWDPDNKQYDIFENNLFIDPEDLDKARYFETPFGTAIEGDYTIKFSVSTLENLNLYIRIEKGPKSLYDKIPMEEQESIVLYHITRFYSGMSTVHNLTLKTDYMYKFYFGRVSPISIMENSQVDISFSITDSETVVFTIYSNQTLTPINNVNISKFGTAIDGMYQENLTIQSGVQYTNIGYAVIEHHRISDLVDPNETVIPDLDPANNTEFQKNIFSMPQEWGTGILVFFGSILVIIVIVVVKNRKKNVEFHERIDRYGQDNKEKAEKRFYQGM